MSSSAVAERLQGLSAGIARVAAGGTGWRAFAAPAAFLLAVTIAVVVVSSTRESATSPRAKAAKVTSAAKGSPSKTRAAAKRRFYSIVAGDTLAGIASKTGVSLARIRALNPNVTPTALFVDQRIRLE